MNVTDIVRRVQREYGDSAGSQIKESDIIDWINDGQEDIVRETNCLRRTATGSILANAGTFSLPASPRPFKILRVVVDDYKLRPSSLQSLDSRHAYSDFKTIIGQPIEYYFFNGEITVYPKKDIISDIEVEYTVFPAVVTITADPLEIPSYLHRDLVDWCLAHAASFDRDSEAHDRYMARYQERIARSISDQHEQQSHTYPAIRDDDDSMYGYYGVTF